MLDHTATAWLRRLLTWLELFEASFSRQSQRGALRRYVTGLLSDSRRKSMEAMWARLSDPGTYQAFQHFITHAPWDAEALWKRLRAVVPERTGVLILDGTSFPKQGTASVGVARQYCGARGKIANCQVAVTVALWTGVRAWVLGATLYLLGERDLGPTPRTKYYLVDLPPTASLRALVHLAHQRWAIEQQYQELKDEIGLDHFEGRSLPGWQRHAVLTAIAYSFLQSERRRRGQTRLTLPRVRAVIQEVLTAHFFMTQPHYMKWMLRLKEVEMRK